MAGNLYPIVKSIAVTSVCVFAIACSAGSDPIANVAAISNDEALVRTTGYLDSIEGPPILLWNDVGAPAFSPQSCAAFVGLGSDENTADVRDEGEGNFLVSLTDTRRGSNDEMYQWRYSARTGDIASLQEIC